MAWFRSNKKNRLMRCERRFEKALKALIPCVENIEYSAYDPSKNSNFYKVNHKRGCHFYNKKQTFWDLDSSQLDDVHYLFKQAVSTRKYHNLYCSKR